MENLLKLTECMEILLLELKIFMNIVICADFCRLDLIDKCGPCNLYTVLVQIFEGHIFRGCHKFSIFAILFSRITGFRIGRLCAHYHKI